MMTSHTTRASQVPTVLRMAVAALVTLGTTAPVLADGPDPRVAGTYAVEVTIRDCTTGAPAGPPFEALVTLHAGGTVTETPGTTSFALGQRSDGHGAWDRTGRRTYSQEMIALIRFETAANLPGTPTFDPTKPVTPGFKAGWQTVSHTITFSDATHATSTGGNAFYDSAGNQYRTGCSTAVLERVLAP